MSEYTTSMIVHATPVALKAFRAETLPRLTAQGVTVRGEQSTSLWLHEEKIKESLLTDVSHGISLMLPELSLFLSFKTDAGVEKYFYVRSGCTLAYRYLPPVGAPNPEALKREWGPVGFMEAAFRQFAVADE